MANSVSYQCVLCPSEHESLGSLFAHAGRFHQVHSPFEVVQQLRAGQFNLYEIGLTEFSAVMWHSAPHGAKVSRLADIAGNELAVAHRARLATCRFCESLNRQIIFTEDYYLRHLANYHSNEPPQQASWYLRECIIYEGFVPQAPTTQVAFVTCLLCPIGDLVPRSHFTEHLYQFHKVEKLWFLQQQKQKCPEAFTPPPYHMRGEPDGEEDLTARDGETAGNDDDIDNVLGLEDLMVGTYRRH